MRGLAEKKLEWISVAAPPAAYTIVLLAFDDGSVRRGVWNGKMWWGYDDRVRRACELHPLRWHIWNETMPTITKVARACHTRDWTRSLSS
jgi:hypothetical protein